MKPILILNPNSNETTTEMMLAMARAVAPDRAFVGATLTSSPAMIVTEEALLTAEAGVLALGLAQAPHVAGVAIAAFGDPAADALARRLAIPVVGICAASMIEAAAGGRRFGVATTTPALRARIDASAARLGLQHLYTGARFTAGDPIALSANPAGMLAALEETVAECFATDGAEAVIIGGGPLSQAAAALARRFKQPVIAPVAAAVRHLLRMT